MIQRSRPLRRFRSFSAGTFAGRVLLLFLLMGIGSSARAQPAGEFVIDSVELGFQGLYKVGYWTPITVHLTGGDEPVEAHVEVIVPDGDGVPSKFVSQPLKLPSGQSVAHQLCVRIGRTAPAIRVRLVSDGATLADRTFAGETVPRALSASQELFLVVGPSPDFDAADRLYERSAAEQDRTAVLDSVEQLPNQWYAYDGVDLVWLSTTEPERYDAFSPSDARAQALDEWVRMGGQLVLTAGVRAEAVIAPGAPLERFLPGRFEGVAPLRQFSLIENYSESLEPLPLLVEGRRLTLQIPRITDVEGTIEVPGDLPLVIRSTRGFGRVTFAGLDLEGEPFPSWKGRGHLINRLLGRPNRPVERQRGETGRVSHVGFNDLAGQLRGSLDQFQGVQLVSFVTVGGLIGLYALLIGPVDYFLIRRIWKNRPGWAAAPWITFPVMVVGFSALAWAMAERTKTDVPRLNQVNLVDVDLTPQEPLVRGQSWFTVYTPGNVELDVAVDPRLQPQVVHDSSSLEQLTSWFGLPGTGIGGMSAGAAEQPLFTDGYRYSADLAELHGVPVAIWSTKSFHAFWRAQRGPLGLDAQLREGQDQRDDLLAGSIRNSLGFPLSECVLIYREPAAGGNVWAYRLGTIGDGESLTLSRRFDPVPLITYLTPRQAEAIVPYDETSFDQKRILTMMMFHKHAGGRAYTGLLNRYLHRLDLSDHLQSGRAILVGQGASAAKVQLNGEVLEPDEEPLTFYRFILPIAESSAQ